MTEQLLQRLESVTQRLENVSRKMGGGGGDENSTPQYITDFDNFINTEIKEVISTTQTLKFPEPVADIITKGFNNLNSLIKKIPKLKKPNPTSLMNFLKDCSDAIQTTDKMKYRGIDFKQFGDHYKAIYEFVNSLQWIIQDPVVGQFPAKFAQGQLEATDFNLNRVIKTNNDESTKKWIQAIKKANKKQVEFVEEYFKSGVTWNPNGVDLDSVKDNDDNKTSKTTTTTTTTKPTSTTTTTTTTKPTPTTTTTTTTNTNTTTTSKDGNTSNLFSQLNRGNVGAKGFGLKKVDDKDKTKNRDPNERSGKVVVTETKKDKRKKNGPPQTVLKGFRWVVENYDEGVHKVEKADTKSNVYINMCDDCAIEVPSKVKSVSIDNCIKCRVFINDIISTVEIVNCKSVTLVCQGVVQSIAVDKSQSPKIILTPKSYANPPDIITSNISAMNVEVPGKTEKDDNIELPVPEQFLTKIDPKTNQMTTTSVKHG